MVLLLMVGTAWAESPGTAYRFPYVKSSPTAQISATYLLGAETPWGVRAGMGLVVANTSPCEYNDTSESCRDNLGLGSAWPMAAPKVDVGWNQDQGVVLSLGLGLGMGNAYDTTIPAFRPITQVMLEPGLCWSTGLHGTNVTLGGYVVRALATLEREGVQDDAPFYPVNGVTGVAPRLGVESIVSRIAGFGPARLSLGPQVPVLGF